MRSLPCSSLRRPIPKDHIVAPSRKSSHVTTPPRTSSDHTPPPHTASHHTSWNRVRRRHTLGTHGGGDRPIGSAPTPHLPRHLPMCAHLLTATSSTVDGLLPAVAALRPRRARGCALWPVTWRPVTPLGLGASVDDVAGGMLEERRSGTSVDDVAVTRWAHGELRIANGPFRTNTRADQLRPGRCWCPRRRRQTSRPAQQQRGGLRLCVAFGALALLCDSCTAWITTHSPLRGSRRWST